MALGLDVGVALGLDVGVALGLDVGGGKHGSNLSLPATSSI